MKRRLFLSLGVGLFLSQFNLGSTFAEESNTNAPILAHNVWGKGAEKVLVLHSWMGDASSFDLVKPYLNQERYTYVFADLRGYGGSINVEGTYDEKEISADAIRLADHLGWGRFHLVGHSMSGMAVQRIAIDDWTQNWNRIKSVIAISPVTADGFPVDEPTRKFLWDLIHNQSLSEQGVAGMTGQRLLPRWAELKVDKHLATSQPEAMKGYFHMWVDSDFSQEAAEAKLTTPILVIGGRQDLPGFLEEKYRTTFAKWYPNVEMKFITDAGHFSMYETPVYLATLVEGFLDRFAGGDLD